MFYWTGAHYPSLPPSFAAGEGAIRSLGGEWQDFPILTSIFLTATDGEPYSPKAKVPFEASRRRVAAMAEHGSEEWQDSPILTLILLAASDGEPYSPKSNVPLIQTTCILSIFFKANPT